MVKKRFAHFVRWAPLNIEDLSSYVLTNTCGPICLIPFLHYSIVQSQSLTPYFYKTKEYSDMSLYMDRKIRS